MLLIWLGQDNCVLFCILRPYQVNFLQLVPSSYNLGWSKIVHTSFLDHGKEHVVEIVFSLHFITALCGFKIFRAMRASSIIRRISLS